MNNSVHLITASDTLEVEVDSLNSDLFLDADTLLNSTGWQLKPEGFCRGDICIPARDAVDPKGKVNLSTFATLTGSALVTDLKESAVSLGAAHLNRGEDLSSLIAPDFELPDANGKLHRLSDYRGKKLSLIHI